MGGGDKAPLRHRINRKLRLEFHGATITSDAGLLRTDFILVAVVFLAGMRSLLILRRATQDQYRLREVPAHEKPPGFLSTMVQGPPGV